jgi:hypothetical protein
MIWDVAGIFTMPEAIPAGSLDDPIEETISYGETPWKTLLWLYRPEARRILLAAGWYGIKSSPLWILPLNALDAGSESLVQEALNRLMRGRTTFIVAHRLSTTRRADLMMALEAGRVIQIGPPEEVLRRQGLETAALEGLHSKVERPASPFSV